MKLIVLMQNDYPIGIYSGAIKASGAAISHYKKRYEGLNTGMTMLDYHYRQYDFVVDDVAKQIQQSK